MIRIFNFNIYRTKQVRKKDGIVRRSLYINKGEPDTVDEVLVNDLTLEICKRRGGLGFYVIVSQDRDDDFILHLQLPYIVNLYFSIRSVKWLKRLWGVRYERGNRLKIEKSLGFKYDGLGWFYFYPMVNHQHDWALCFNPKEKIADLVLGAEKIKMLNSKIERVYIIMSEGRDLKTYKGSAVSYTNEYRRRRWPYAKIKSYVEITIPEGIPIPSKGDNDYDLGDDAIYSITKQTADINTALSGFIDAVLRARDQYGVAFHGIGDAPELGIKSK